MPVNRLEVLKELEKELKERKNFKLKHQNSRLLVSEDYLQIEYEPVNHWIYADWKGYQTEDSIKNGCESILKFMIQFKCQKVLNDNTNVIGIWTPASVWVGSNWFPRIIAAGLKSFAWIYSPSVLSQVSTEETLKNTMATEIIKTFYGLTSGKEWLISR